MIRAVLFDAAGTLIRLRETVGASYAKIALRHGMELDPGATDAAFRQVWKAMPPMGSPPDPHGDRCEKSWWRRIVENVLDRLGADESSASREAYFEDLFDSYARPEMWQAYPETQATLEPLRASGLRLFVLSNFDARLLRVLAGLGLDHYFETIFYSGAIGHAKPSREIFDHAVAEIGLGRHECLHVGDDPEADWAGARRAGLQAFELDRRRHDLRAVLEHPELPVFSD